MQSPVCSYFPWPLLVMRQTLQAQFPPCQISRFCLTSCGLSLYHLVQEWPCWRLYLSKLFWTRLSAHDFVQIQASHLPILSSLMISFHQWQLHFHSHGLDQYHLFNPIHRLPSFLPGLLFRLSRRNLDVTINLRWNRSYFYINGNYNKLPKLFENIWKLRNGYKLQHQIKI